jgi:hypothetical protein
LKSTFVPKSDILLDGEGGLRTRTIELNQNGNKNGAGQSGKSQTTSPDECIRCVVRWVVQPCIPCLVVWLQPLPHPGTVGPRPNRTA